MNLAEQVRQVHELKKDYEAARHSLKKPYINFAIADDDLEGHFKRIVTRAESDAVYFVDEKDDYNEETLDEWIYWFSCPNTLHSDAEKIAKKHGFTTELVELEDVLGWELVSPIKALKITWGDLK